jgi:hypothetical protein
MEFLDTDLHVQDLVWHEKGRVKISAMSFKYRSGEEILAGDRILYASEPGTIDFVTTPEDSEHAWHVEQFGGGCMILAPSFGRVFVSKPQDDEDLEFVSRSGSAPIA